MFSYLLFQLVIICLILVIRMSRFSLELDGAIAILTMSKYAGWLALLTIAKEIYPATKMTKIGESTFPPEPLLLVYRISKTANPDSYGGNAYEGGLYICRAWKIKLLAELPKQSGY